MTISCLVVACGDGSKIISENTKKNPIRLEGK